MPRRRLASLPQQWRSRRAKRGQEIPLQGAREASSSRACFRSAARGTGGGGAPSVRSSHRPPAKSGPGGRQREASDVHGGPTPSLAAQAYCCRTSVCAPTPRCRPRQRVRTACCSRRALHQTSSVLAAVDVGWRRAYANTSVQVPPTRAAQLVRRARGGAARGTARELRAPLGRGTACPPLCSSGQHKGAPAAALTGVAPPARSTATAAAAAAAHRAATLRPLTAA